MKTLGERIKELEDKVTKLEGGLPAKFDSVNPYKSKSKKETKPFEKDNE
jgi:hypothetical protein